MAARRVQQGPGRAGSSLPAAQVVTSTVDSVMPSIEECRVPLPDRIQRKEAQVKQIVSESYFLVNVLVSQRVNISDEMFSGAGHVLLGGSHDCRPSYTNNFFRFVFHPLLRRERFIVVCGRACVCSPVSRVQVGSRREHQSQKCKGDLYAAASLLVFESLFAAIQCDLSGFQSICVMA